MFKPASVVPCVLCLLIGAIPARAQVKPDVIERGRSATALVEVVDEKGQATGSAFCIDPSGLFVTNAHVTGGGGAGARIQLVLDIGRRTQRSLRATPLWMNEEQDLALLKVQPGGRGLVALTLGRDADLEEGAEVATFGFPFGKQMALDQNRYPEVSVNLSRVMTLRKERDRLGTIKFDGQLNPGNSGGPVLGPGGKVVGVAVATVLGGGVNFAIPVGQLTEALARPGLQFLMLPLLRADRMRPVTWQFHAVPPWPSGKLPEGLTLAVTVTANVGEPRVFTGRPSGNGAYQVTLTPVPSDPDRKVVLWVQMGKNMTNPAVAEVKDVDVTIGPRSLRLSDLRMISFRPGPNDRSYVILHEGGGVEGPIRGLGTVQAQRDRKTIAIDLTQTEKIEIRPSVDRYASTHTVDVLAELRDGATTLGTCHKRLDFTTDLNITAKMTGGDFVVVRPEGRFANRGLGGVLDDDDQVTIGGPLDVDGAPRGAIETIRPPMIPPLDGVAGPPPAGGAPKGALVRALKGEVSDVAVGGGGRYLLLVSKKARKLAIFDVNAADVVKTVSLPTDNVLVAAGARKFIVAFPDEELIQRWDLEHLTVEGGFRPSPIKGELKDLAMGSDSDGPLLAYWNPSKPSYGPQRLSFIDLNTLDVLKVGPVSGTHCEVSPTRGTFTLGGGISELRASPGGNLFGVGQFATLSVRGGRLGAYSEDIHASGFVAPGADGVTIFTGLLGRLDAFGNTVGAPPDPSLNLQWNKNRHWQLLTVPSASPFYYLVLGAAPFSKGQSYEPKGPVSASIHSAGDGARLLTIPALEEMTGFSDRDWFSERLMVEKRFHFIPAAKLLITIPPKNDRLVLRRVDIDAAVAQTADAILILSPPLINACAGQPLRARIQAKSAKGDVQLTLVDGPEGLSIAPDGQISWPVPELPSGGAAKIVLSLRDPAGRSRSHEVVIRVQ